MILVTGATGTIGGEVVRLLIRQGEAVRAMTRDPSRARLPDKVDVVAANFENADSLRRAAYGVDAVFLATAPGAAIPDHDRAMLAAARAAGVGTVVKLSAIGGRANSERTPANWHAPGERAVHDSGMTWTLLRPSSYASNALRWADAIRAGQPVPNMFGDGVMAIVDPRDVAAVAVAVLRTDAHHGQTYTLTGPELLSVPDQLAQLTELLGRTIDSVDVSPEVAQEQMRAAGMDPTVVEVAIKGAELVRTGGAADRTDDVGQVLGRPAGSFRNWARDHRAAFANGGQAAGDQTAPPDRSKRA